MAIPIPRDPDIDLSEVPRHWAGTAAGTAISNGLNMLFPHGERFFVRSVHQFLDQVKDPELKAKVKAFFKQEGHHAHAHDELNDVLRKQGYQIDQFLDRYQKITVWLEKRMPAKLNLASTAAAEHFTAIMAEGAFSKGVLDVIHPSMRTLLSWHAAEEIEHKAVAFDVLKEVDDSYALRMAGLAYATLTLGAFWFWASTMLMRQERLTWRKARAQLREMQARDPVLRRVFGAGIKQYLRRDFHPSQNANEHLARTWFAAHGMPFTEVV